MTLAIILLAAGSSQRFGVEEKLLAPLHGIPLVCHAARTLATLPAALHLAVVSSPEVAQCLQAEGFTTHVPEVTRALSHSLSTGIAAADRSGASHCLLALGDMPFVTPADFQLLLALQGTCAAAMRANGVAMPPALFPRSDFARLQSASGDQGARAFLQNLTADRYVDLCGEHLSDIDTPQDLHRLR
jgi:molybdenum cofactor cytidylyltransferase